MVGGLCFVFFSFLQGWLCVGVCVSCDVLKIAWCCVGKVMDACTCVGCSIG